MKIAVPSRDRAGLEDQVEEHFGRARYYTLVDVENGTIVNTEVLEVPYAEHGPGDLPNWLHSYRVDVVLAWGMGRRAADFFQQLGIEVVTGAAGRIRDLVEGYIHGSLETVEWTGHKGQGCDHGRGGCDETERNRRGPQKEKKGN